VLPKLVLLFASLSMAITISCRGGKTAPSASVTAPVGSAAEATQAPTDRPAPAASPAAGATITAGALRVGAPVPLPDNVALIVETGCWQCDGDYGRLVRIYRDESGALRETPLAGAAGGHVVSPDGSQVAYSWCSRGTCDGFNAPSPDVQSTIAWSRDGGITSETFAPLDGVYDVAAVTRGMLLARGQTADLQPLPLRRYPGGDVLTSPPGAVYPVVLGWDQSAWLTADRTTILAGPDVESLDLGQGHEINSIAAEDVAGDRFAIDWSERVSGGDVRFYKSIVSLAGQRFRIERTFPVDGSFGQSGGWLDAHTLIGTYDFRAADLPAPAGAPDRYGTRPLPALFDLNTSTIHPILDPFASNAPYAGGRNIVVAVVHGPFVRVTSTGSCLNIRAEAHADAPARACAADDVLLRTLGKEQSADGKTWLLVAMPDGVDGWVSSEYLAR
jgi:hypothetical protein